MIHKTANDVFYRSKLGSTLSKLQIKEIIVTGSATDFCVDSTVKSALTDDYTVTVVADGHTTSDRPDLRAEQVINHYNWVSSNILPTKGKIIVKNYYEIKNEISESLAHP